MGEGEGLGAGVADGVGTGVGVVPGVGTGPGAGAPAVTVISRAQLAVSAPLDARTEALNVPGISYTCVGLRFPVVSPSPKDHS